MRLGYTILYVPDVRAGLAFYGKAFGPATRFVHESGDWGELETAAPRSRSVHRPAGANGQDGGAARRPQALASRWRWSP